MLTYSLLDLNDYLRRVIALNFAQPLWVEAEIAQAGNARGHWYFELIQKGAEQELVAQAQAALWANDYRRLLKLHGPAFQEALQTGMSVKLQVKVEFHERFGLKLIIQDVDVVFTFGQLELQRRQAVEALRSAGLLERNAALALPPVLQRIAVISSEGAAGYQDFCVHLAENSFGYTFQTTLFASAVQGQLAEKELIAALGQVAYRHREFDALVLIRGGGSRLDLAVFDRLELCRQAALSPLPVLSGVGHDTDQSVLDLVAHTALKTPTAVADFLIQHNLFFENNLLRLSEQLRGYCEQSLLQAHLNLQQCGAQTYAATRERLRLHGQRLDQWADLLPLYARQSLQRQEAQISQIAVFCEALKPENALKRGYSITRKNGVVVQSAEQLQAGDSLETALSDGSVKSIVA